MKLKTQSHPRLLEDITSLQELHPSKVSVSSSLLSSTSSVSSLEEEQEQEEIPQQAISSRSSTRAGSSSKKPLNQQCVETNHDTTSSNSSSILLGQVSIMNRSSSCSAPTSSDTVRRRLLPGSHYYSSNGGRRGDKAVTVLPVQGEPNQRSQDAKRKISIDSPLMPKESCQTLPLAAVPPLGIPIVVNVGAPVPQQPNDTSTTRSSKKRKLDIVHKQTSKDLLLPRYEGQEDTNKSILLLARKEDADHLNPIHCFVRQNIEVFVASEEDITAPCPGRKNTIKAGQVGLRCIHCRHVKNRNRAKRAVCYPSTIARVYNCVSDMKFDHFSLCKYLPALQRDIFNSLRNKKESQARGKGGNNTSKYYYDTAIQIGMRETLGGIVLLDKFMMSMDTDCNKAFGRLMQRTVSNVSLTASATQNNLCAPTSPAHTASPMVQSVPRRQEVLTTHLASRQDSAIPIFSDRRLLATPNDDQFLNPVHCFVRKNVEVFIANASDVEAPAPGRKKPIVMGQVGIRCIHCKDLPPKYRVKRAICYPPTIASLYHAVSNMKFDHYGACRGLSPQERQSFSDLKAASSNRKAAAASGGLASRNSASLARYYQQSARRDLGLFDTDDGIRVINNTFLQNRTSYRSSLPSCTDAPVALSVSMGASPQIRSSVSVISDESAFVQTSSPLAKSSSGPRDSHQMDGMSALMMAATDSRFSQQYGSFNLISS